MDKFAIVFISVALVLGLIVGRNMRGSSTVARRIVGMLVLYITFVITSAIMDWAGW